MGYLKNQSQMPSRAETRPQWNGLMISNVAQFYGHEIMTKKKSRPFPKFPKRDQNSELDNN